MIYNGGPVKKMVSDMSSATGIFLPTEIVLQIVSRVDRSLRGDERQQTLYRLCLVSHQWYSAALSFLYARPRLEKGNTYRKFTDVLCPPASAPKKNKDLGGLVRRLDLSRLVHHSSNSMTARLIGRVRENLEVFIAPASGFSVNSFSALSKCTKLRYLDLFLVHESFQFDTVIKSLRYMRHLVDFRAPGFMRLTHDTMALRAAESSDNPKWPPSIKHLQLSGTIDIRMETFRWPENMTHLTLKHCMNLSLDVMTGILSNRQLEGNLKRLTISTYNRGLQPECIHLVPAFLPNLLFLSIPGDLVQDMFFSMIEYRGTKLALEVLELGLTHTSDKLDFSMQSLINVLDASLPNLRAVGFHTMYGDDFPDLDDALLERAEEKGDELHVSDETAEFDAGTYYFD